MAQQIGNITQTSTGHNYNPVVTPPANTRSPQGDIETFFVKSFNGKIITARRQRKLDFSKAKAGRGFGYDAVKHLVNKDRSRSKKIMAALEKGYSLGQAKRRAAAA